MGKFNAKEVKNRIVQWIRDWFEENGYDCNAVVGISGGTDSSVVSALCVEALGKDRVFGVLRPCGEQSDIEYSKKLVEHLRKNNLGRASFLPITSVKGKKLEKIKGAFAK